MIKDEAISKTLFTSEACKEFFLDLNSLVSFTKTENNRPEKNVFCLLYYFKSMLVQQLIDFIQIFSGE